MSEPADPARPIGYFAFASRQARQWQAFYLNEAVLDLGRGVVESLRADGILKADDPGFTPALCAGFLSRALAGDYLGCVSFGAAIAADTEERYFLVRGNPHDQGYLTELVTYPIITMEMAAVLERTTPIDHVRSLMRADPEVRAVEEAARSASRRAPADDDRTAG